MPGRNDGPMHDDAPMHRAWLGLGGNIGDPVAAMRRALQHIDGRADAQVSRVSPVYRTPPWGLAEQPEFLNAAAEIRTRLEPEALLDAVLETELQLKRVRSVRWGPRTIDIDVLAYENIEANSERLTLPHPRMTERAFVMVPLADIAPDLMISGKRVREWAAQADRAGIESAISGAQWWREPAEDGGRA